MAMIYAVGHISGAHFNPAVTFAFALSRHFPWPRAVGYWAAQLAGALAAAAILRGSLGNIAHVGATFPSGSQGQSFLWELVLSFFLMFVIMAVATDTRAVGEAAAIAIGGTVGLDAMFGGPISGASMNPARSIGPAIVSGDLHALWLYIVAPDPRRRRSPRSPTSSSADEPRPSTPTAKPRRLERRSRARRSSSEPRSSIVGGSDAGISAALRARELDPAVEVDGRARGRLPELLDLRDPVLPLRRCAGLARPRAPHDRRPRASRDRAAARTHRHARSTPSCARVARHRLGWGRAAASATTSSSSRPGPLPVRPPTRRARHVDGVSPAAHDGRHLRARRGARRDEPESAVIVGAGYIGLEMAEALRARGLARDARRAAARGAADRRPRARRARPRQSSSGRGVDGPDGTTVNAIERTRRGASLSRATEPELSIEADIVLVVVGVRPDTELGAAAGIDDGSAGALAVDRQMRDEPRRHLRGRRLRRHLPPPARRHLPPARNDRAQARPGRGRERASAAAASSRAASAPRSSRSSSTPPPAPACATTKPRRRVRPDHGRVRRRRPQGLLPREPTHRMRITGDRHTDRCSASSSSGTATPRSPNASTSPRRPSTTG